MRMPLYRKIGEELAARIAAGRYAMGSFLPVEGDLCKEFAVSHHTVRDALKLLIERGLVLRRAGSGTRVIATQEPTVFAHIAADLRHVFSYPADALRENVQEAYVQADAALAAKLKCPPNTPWFHIGAIRRDARTLLPICWTDFYLLPRHAPVVKLKQHLLVPVFEQIEQLHGQRVQSAEVVVQLVRLNKVQAQCLGKAAGNAALMIMRRYCDETGTPFEVTISYHADDNYQCQIGFQRERRLR
jgi:GntR family transcriptional regulator